MKNFIESGKVLTFTVPEGESVAAGDFVRVGKLHGFAITDAVAGESVSVTRAGVFSAGKDGNGIAAGDPLYFNDGTKLFSAIPAGDVVAVAVEDALAGDASCALVLMPAAMGGVTLSDLAAMTAGKGISLLGLVLPDPLPPDFGDIHNLQDLIDRMFEGGGGDSEEDRDIHIPAGAATGSEPPNQDFIGAQVMSCTPLSGNDQIVTGASVGVDGSITVTVAANETAEAIFRVVVRKSNNG